MILCKESKKPQYFRHFWSYMSNRAVGLATINHGEAIDGWLSATHPAILRSWYGSSCV